MSIRIEPLSVDQNSDTTIIRTFLQPNGSPINFTGWSAKMRIRQTQDPSSATILSLSSGLGITLGGTLGTITITLTNVQTVAISLGTYYYDLMMIDTLAKQNYYMAGQFVVLGTVAR